MNNEWQLAGARSSNMGTEPLPLPVQGLTQTKVIKTGFADCDHFAVRAGTFDQIINRWLGCVLVIRMDAHRSKKLRMRCNHFN